MHDLFIEVYIGDAEYLGHMLWVWVPTVQVATIVPTDSGNKATATVGKQPYYSENRGKWYNQYKFNKFHMNSVYCFDVADYNPYIDITGQLWDSSWGSGAAINIFSRTFRHYINWAGYSHNYPLSSGENRIYYTVKTIGLDKINTIAIYENGSFVNDRYNQIQHYCIIFIDVSSSNAIFMKGANAILIPSDLFVDTRLHSMIEKSVNDQGQIDLSKFEGEYGFLQQFNFIGMDRNSETVSSHIDSMISPGDDVVISPEEASTLLDLLLYSANESIAEPICLYMKKDPIEAGLPYDVVQSIPFNGNNLAESEYGTIPTTLLQSIANLFTTIGVIIIAGLVILAKLFLALVSFIVKLGLWVIGLFKDKLDLIEKVVKGIILVLAYALFAIDFLQKTLMYGGIGLALLGLSFITQNVQLQITMFNPFSLDFYLGEMHIFMMDRYTTVHNEFLDLDLPAVENKVVMGNLTMTHTLSVFLLMTVINLEDYSSNEDFQYYYDLVNQTLSEEGGESGSGMEEQSAVSPPGGVEPAYNPAYSPEASSPYPISSNGNDFNLALANCTDPDNDSAYSIGLKWDAVSNAAYYEVNRSAFSDMTNATLVGNTTNLEFEDLPNIEICYYQVAAFDAAGNRISNSNISKVDLPELLNNSSYRIPMFINPEYEIEGESVSFSVWCKENVSVMGVFLLYRFRKEGADWKCAEDMPGGRRPSADSSSVMENNWTKYKWGSKEVEYSTYVWFNFYHLGKNVYWVPDRCANGTFNYEKWGNTTEIFVWDSKLQDSLTLQTATLILLVPYISFFTSSVMLSIKNPNFQIPFYIGFISAVGFIAYHGFDFAFSYAFSDIFGMFETSFGDDIFTKTNYLIYALIVYSVISLLFGVSLYFNNIVSDLMVLFSYIITIVLIYINTIGGLLLTVIIAFVISLVRTSIGIFKTNIFEKLGKKFKSLEKFGTKFADLSKIMQLLGIYLMFYSILLLSAGFCFLFIQNQLEKEYNTSYTLK
ncbi:MAG: hypothetical protein ACTSO2_19305 [Promethearchaeota archaeon]